MNKIEIFSIVLLILFIAYSFFGPERSVPKSTETLGTFKAFDVSRISSSTDITAALANFNIRIPSFGSLFGGRIGNTKECKCTGDLRFAVGRPRPGTFMLTSRGAQIFFREFNPVSGAFTAGIASGFKICWVFNPIPPPICIPAGGGPVVQLMGTSF